MASIHPKPTNYRGTLYRSRLEARWAIFLDSLRIAYYYESYIFHDRETNWTYTPDFYLPNPRDLILEVKPAKPTREYCHYIWSMAPQTLLCCGSFYSGFSVYRKGEKIIRIPVFQKLLRVSARKFHSGIKTVNGYRFDLR